MLLVSLAMGTWSWIKRPYKLQAEALAALEGKIQFVRTEPGQPEWLQPLFDEEEFRDVVHLSFHGKSKFTDEDAVHLRRFPRLFRLSLHGTGVHDEGLAQIARLNNLDTLSLKRTSITDDGLVHLSKLPRLKKLQISESQTLQGSCLQHVANLKSLEELEIRLMKPRDEDLKHIAKLTNLRSLIVECNIPTSESLSRLSKLPYLRTLDVRTTDLPPAVRLSSFPRIASLNINCSKVKQLRIEDMPRLQQLAVFPYGKLKQTDVELINLPRLGNIRNSFAFVKRLRMESLPSLTSLNFTYTAFDECVLKDLPSVSSVNLNHACVNGSLLDSLANLSSLKQLYLNSAFRVDHPVAIARSVPRRERLPLRHQEISRVAKLQQLQLLDASGIGMNDDAAKWLSSLGQLMFLNLRYNPISDDATKGFNQLTRLETLMLSNTRIGDSTLAALSKLETLRTLQLNDTNVSDSGLRSVGKLGNLQHLELANTKVTNAGLNHLNSLMDLRSLNLRGTEVTLDGVVHLCCLPELGNFYLPQRSYSVSHFQDLRAIFHPSLPPDPAKIMAELGEVE